MAGLRILAYGRACVMCSATEQIAIVERWTLAGLNARMTLSGQPPPPTVREWPPRQDVVDAVRRGEIDALGVTELSRFGESAGAMASLAKDMAEAGVKLAVASTEQIVDLESRAGRQLVQGLVLAARLEAMFAFERRRRPRGPRRAVDLVEVERLMRESKTLTEIAALLGVGRATIVRRRAAARTS